MLIKPNDFTKVIEDVVKEEAETLAEILREELSTMRPVGSAEVSEDEQRAEWMMMQDNPMALAKFFTDQNVSVASAIRYAHRMMQEKK